MAIVSKPNFIIKPIHLVKPRDHSFNHNYYKMELEVRKPKLPSSGKTINLYKYPPSLNLNLEECQDLFRQRLECLHIFEKIPDYASQNRSADIAKAIRDIKSYVYKTNCLLNSVKDDKLQQLDHCSHMLARMYCIHNSTLWNWFKIGEKRLMNHRLKHDMSLTSDQLEAMLLSLEFDFERVAMKELLELKGENVIGWNSRDKEPEEVFKIHFTNALKFISRRSVALKNGYAFLTRSEIISVVCDVFESHLENEFKFGTQHLDLNNIHVRQLLESLEIVYLDFEDIMSEEKRKLKKDADGENQNPYRIDIDDIEDICKQHFPPCMKYLQESLIQDHHLKHSGRVIYGTFLRSGGVDMDTAIEFWRKEFTKKIPNDKFERDYKYNIRHLYGREGHKKALSCFSCDKIINDNPGPADKHGCPFKHFDENNLKTMMSKNGLKEEEVDYIMSFRKEKEFKLGCSHYFRYLKGELPSEPIKNPIHYYYESRRIAVRKLKELENPEAFESETECGKIEQNTNSEIPKKAVTSYADEDDEMTDDF